MKAVLLIGLFFISLPAITFAQEGFPGLVSFAGCTGPDCSACNVVYMANEGIKWIIGFLFIIFAIVLVVRGTQLVTGRGSRDLSDTKEAFMNAFIGIIIILGAWVLVDTIMRALLGGNGNIPIFENGRVTGRLAWSEVECQVQAAPNFDELHMNEDTSIIPPLVPGPGGLPVENIGSNCGVDESSLVSIPGQGSHRATAGTVSRFVSMKNSLATRGITLRVTSSYRSDARQTELWDECPTCQTERTVARPCSRGGNGSHHSSGAALDLSSSGGNQCDVIRACRAAGAGFIMTYQRSGHVHCDWGGSRSESIRISCP